MTTLLDFDTFATATNKPASGNNANGALLYNKSWFAVVKQIALLIMTTRRLTGSNSLQEWRQYIHSGNIGGQSVNYATTAGHD
jgi:hypothetical protein